MKKIAFLFVIFITSLNLVGQNEDLKHRIGLNAGSSIWGTTTNTLVHGSLVKKAKALPVPVISYTYEVAQDLTFGVTASHQLFAFELFPIDTLSNIVDIKINRLNCAFKTNYYFINKSNFDLYMGAKLGGSFWFGNISFKTLYDYIVRISPPLIEDVVIKNIVPSNVKFVSFFFSGQLNVGFDYYFIKNVGINAELAIGAPYWAATGLTFRL